MYVKVSELIMKKEVRTHTHTHTQDVFLKVPLPLKLSWDVPADSGF